MPLMSRVGHPRAPESVAQLQQLADFNAQGVLSDEEFATAKARLLE
jgi:hypothetical protein